MDERIDIEQGTIIEVDFKLPNGLKKMHPALVISPIIEDYNSKLFYAVLISSKDYNKDYTLEIKPEWIEGKKFIKQSFFVTHIISSFNQKDVQRTTGYIKDDYIPNVFSKIIKTLFDLDIDFES